MEIKFVKMQGTGNDFIMIENQEFSSSKLSKLAIKLCDRHYGVGGDGLIAILPATDNQNDYQMRIFNQDGSEAEMCGNGIRCFSHYLNTIKNYEKDCYKIETKAGTIKCEILTSKQRESIVRVNMGRPSFSPDDIPIKVNDTSTPVEDYLISIDKKEFKLNCVSMGNPHSVIFVKKTDKQYPQNWGKSIENLPIFPEKTNVEFIEVISRKEVKMEVWERGSGRTLACGTGACAAAVVGINKGVLDEQVKLRLPGGPLIIEWLKPQVMMTGPAVTILKGSIELDSLL
jgi:diaminopimelate epimerase